MVYGALVEAGIRVGAGEEEIRLGGGEEEDGATAGEGIDCEGEGLT